MDWWLILIIIISSIILLWLIIYLTYVIASKKVKVEPYISGYRTSFPNVEDGHVVKTKKKYSYKYDKNFDFRFKKIKGRLLRFLIRTFILLWFGNVIVLPIYGVLIKNKKVFKKYKKLMKDGFITTCNHTFEFDIFVIKLALFPKWPEFPIWKEGAESSLGPCYRGAGRIPLPKGDIKGIYYSMEAMKEVLNEKGWLHIYPEGSCWHYYAPIREYKLGAFKLAYDTNKPIFPLGMSFRKRKGLSRIFTKAPWVTLSIGEPIFVDKSLPEKESIKKLAKEVRNATIHLVGINSEEENNILKKKYNYFSYNIEQ